MGKTISVNVRGQQFDVEITRDHGYEPDTNAHEVEWEFVDMGRALQSTLTDAEINLVMSQIYDALD